MSHLPPRAVIFANGEFQHPNTNIPFLYPDDYLIAADGGARHCRALNLTPHLLIGDLDSTSLAEAAALKAAGAQISQYPTRKDQTDLELALDWAIQNGFTDILILGALGGRWDQTLANLLLPALPAFGPARIQLVDGAQQINLLRGPGSLILSGVPGDTVSLIPIGGEVRGVTTTGLEYPLANGRLAFGSTLGVSNRLTAPEATITLQEGFLVCVLISHFENIGQI